MAADTTIHLRAFNMFTGENREQELERLVREAPNVATLEILWRHRKIEFGTAITALAAQRRKELEESQEPFDTGW